MLDTSRKEKKRKWADKKGKGVEDPVTVVESTTCTLYVYTTTR
jgi:hypothetical protein